MYILEKKEKDMLDCNVPHICDWWLLEMYLPKYTKIIIIIKDISDDSTGCQCLWFT